MKLKNVGAVAGGPVLEVDAGAGLIMGWLSEQSVPRKNCGQPIKTNTRFLLPISVGASSLRIYRMGGAS